MQQVTTNLSDIIQQNKDLIKALEDPDKLFREAALDTVVLISDRVQQFGNKTDETPIKNESSGAEIKGFTNKKGKFYSKARKGRVATIINTPYSQAYAKDRLKDGKQINFVDLTRSVGGMMDNFIMSPAGNTSYVVGFRGDSASDKAKWNEERFGTVFQLSKSESEIIQKVILRQVNGIVRRKNS